MAAAPAAATRIFHAARGAFITPIAANTSERMKRAGRSPIHGSSRNPPASGPTMQPTPLSAQAEPAFRDAPPDQRSTSQGVTKPSTPARGATDSATAAIELRAGTNRPWNRAVPGRRGSAGPRLFTDPSCGFGGSSTGWYFSNMW